ncbi:hypothetical protein MMC18_006488 [Xylographa bjoerkii]|nr:hypothetical protein [Xylographa bjoerkii]
MALLEPKTYRPTRSKRSALPEPNFYKTTSGKRFTEENVDYAIRISPGPADNMEWESTKVVELSTDPMEWAGNALHKGFNWASKWSTMSGSSFLPGETGDDGHGKPVSPHVWRDTWEMEGQAANVIEDPRTSDPRPNSSPQRIERHTRTWTIPLTARPTHPGSGDTIAEKRGKKTRTEENRLLEDIIRASYSSSSSAATSATVISDGEHEPQEISKRPGKGHWWDEWGLLQWVATLWLFGFLAAAALLYAANSSRWSYTGHTYYDFADNDYESEHYLGRSALGRAIFRIGSTLAFTWQGVVEAVTVFFDRYSALTWIRIAATRSISSLASTRISIAVSVFLSKLPFTWKEVVAAILCTPPARIAMAASTIAVLAEIIHYQAGYLTGLWYYILFYLIHFQNLVQRELGLQEDT